MALVSALVSTLVSTLYSSLHISVHISRLNSALTHSRQCLVCSRFSACLSRSHWCVSLFLSVRFPSDQSFCSVSPLTLLSVPNLNLEEQPSVTAHQRDRIYIIKRNNKSYIKRVVHKRSQIYRCVGSTGYGTGLHRIGWHASMP